MLILRWFPKVTGSGEYLWNVGQVLRGILMETYRKKWQYNQFSWKITKFEGEKQKEFIAYKSFKIHLQWPTEKQMSTLSLLEILPDTSLESCTVAIQGTLFILLPHSLLLLGQSSPNNLSYCFKIESQKNYVEKAIIITRYIRTCPNLYGGNLSSPEHQILCVVSLF